MQLSFQQIIFLYGLKKLNGERTIYSLYHLLRGKKSSQTIQDAHLFRLRRLFQTDEHLTREEVAKQGDVLQTAGLLQEIGTERYLLTGEGEKALKAALDTRPLPRYVNGWEYGQRGALLWERLSLAVQVISHLQQRERKYIPVQRKPETLAWVKYFLKQQRLNRNELAKTLYEELSACLESDEHIAPELFVLRLSGAGHIGLTALQAAQSLNLEPVFYHYHFLNVLHYLAASIEGKSNQYPLLSAFLDKREGAPLTNSTRKTYSLLQQGFTIDDIIHIRGLKRSTIEDHLVELALHLSQFPLDEYVHPEKQYKIKEVIRKINTKQLREIRQAIPEASYFEIRLVLAKYGDDIC